MTTTTPQEITRMLQAWSKGDHAALEQLIPIVENTLKQMARKRLRGERQGHILQTGDLLDEVYKSLIEWKNVSWQNRAHFFAVAAEIMRRILINHARKRPDSPFVTLSKAENEYRQRPGELLALDDALKDLAAEYPRHARVVVLRFFGGLDEKEIAEVLGVGLRTVERDWAFARAWLYQKLNRKEEEEKDE
jgi:RNA polymerase sigma factor (TIGR02999 family)